MYVCKLDLLHAYITNDTHSSSCSAKRSWFANFRSERDKEEVVVVFRDSSFPDLKAALLQALKVSSILKKHLCDMRMHMLVVMFSPVLLDKVQQISRSGSFLNLIDHGNQPMVNHLLIVHGNHPHCTWQPPSLYMATTLIVDGNHPHCRWQPPSL